MKFINIVRWALLSSLILCSSVANAGYIDFTTDQNPFMKTEYTFADVLPSVDLTVSAAIWKGAEIADDTHAIVDIDTSGHDDRRLLVRSGNGYGIWDGSGTDENQKIDGNDGNDLLIFNFSKAVNLASIDFSSISGSGDDDFNFGTVEVSATGEFVSFTRLIKQEKVTEEFSLSNYNLYGTTFAVGALRNNDSFRVAGITAVPEPATISLFLIALLSLGLRSKRVS